MSAFPIRTALLAVAATFFLTACMGPYGYSGVSVGIGNGGYYGDPYYGGYGYGYPSDGYGYGYGYGWYDDFYYPGVGYYVYSRDGSRHRWSDGQRRYWEHRRDRRHDHRQVRENWSSYRQSVTVDHRDPSRDVRIERRSYRPSAINQQTRTTVNRSEERQVVRERRESRRTVRRQNRDDRED